METLVYILPSVITGVLGQLLLKHGMSGMGALNLGEGNIVSLVLKVFTNPWVILGLACYVGGLLFWLIALSKAPLSYVYPFAALTMAMVVLSSAIVFGEAITATRLLGVGTIIGGVLLVALSFRS
jgi:multidrug transporter EmrE-like cation transporter